jgi:hypothetical protein
MKSNPAICGFFVKWGLRLWRGEADISEEIHQNISIPNACIHGPVRVMALEMMLLIAIDSVHVIR